MKVRINYAKVNQQINALEKELNELNNQIKKIDQLMIDSRTVWKGQASEAFNKKVTMLRQELLETRQQMEYLITRIKTIANNYKKQEELQQRQAELLKIGK